MNDKRISDIISHWSKEYPMLSLLSAESAIGRESSEIPTNLERKFNAHFTTITLAYSKRLMQDVQNEAQGVDEVLNGYFLEIVKGKLAATQKEAKTAFAKLVPGDRNKFGSKRLGDNDEKDDSQDLKHARHLRKKAWKYEVVIRALTDKSTLNYPSPLHKGSIAEYSGIRLRTLLAYHVLAAFDPNLGKKERPFSNNVLEQIAEERRAYLASQPDFSKAQQFFDSKDETEKRRQKYRTLSGEHLIDVVFNMRRGNNSGSNEHNYEQDDPRCLRGHYGDIMRSGTSNMLTALEAPAHFNAPDTIADFVFTKLQEDPRTLIALYKNMSLIFNTWELDDSKELTAEEKKLCLDFPENIIKLDAELITHLRKTYPAWYAIHQMDTQKQIREILIYTMQHLTCTLPTDIPGLIQDQHLIAKLDRLGKMNTTKPINEHPTFKMIEKNKEVLAANTRINCINQKLNELKELLERKRNEIKSIISPTEKERRAILDVLEDMIKTRANLSGELIEARQHLIEMVMHAIPQPTNPKDNKDHDCITNQILSKILNESTQLQAEIAALKEELAALKTKVESLKKEATIEEKALQNEDDKDQKQSLSGRTHSTLLNQASISDAHLHLATSFRDELHEIKKTMEKALEKKESTPSKAGKFSGAANKAMVDAHNAINQAYLAMEKFLGESQQSNPNYIFDLFQCIALKSEHSAWYHLPDDHEYYTPAFKKCRGMIIATYKAMQEPDQTSPKPTIAHAGESLSSKKG